MVLLTSVAPSQCWLWDETNEASRCPREGDMHAQGPANTELPLHDPDFEPSVPTQATSLDPKA